jgi:hypothetical protein
VLTCCRHRPRKRTSSTPQLIRAGTAGVSLDRS